ncbi:putative methyltransferase [Gluconobacter japonicus]|nr:putative methyltransferase [Gluconobacter japonicus]
MQDFSYTEASVIRKPIFESPSDDIGYWEANPDVATCMLSASQHFVHYGQHEGRMQATNQNAIADIREKKLARIEFRQSPTTPRTYGQPANYMTDAIKRDFHIPSFPPISAHNYGDKISNLQKQHPEWMFLDVGAGLRDSVTSQMVNVDVFPSLSTDVVCIGENLPFADAQFDFVLCAATLEHTKRPWEVAAEICRVLKPGGIVRIDYPFLQPVHGYPSHYFNATPEGNISLFEKWCDIQFCSVEEHFHPVHALRWMMEEWKNGLPETVKTQFGALRVDDFLSSSIPQMIQQPFCKDLNGETLKVICAGSTLEGIKKKEEQFYGSSREEHLAQSALAAQRDLEIIRASTSWKLTAPLRAAFRLFRKKS